ncbi:MAG: phage tail tape measure protein, partial [Bacteroidaceae bacterium]|nr:phage tail tape measure protein [Bacteroidaceae bacterium]
MAKTVLELAVDTGKWDAGIRKAQNALNNFASSQGGFSQAFQKNSEQMQKFLGIMEGTASTANTAKGQMSDYRRSIEQLSAAYEQLSDAQKKGMEGQAVQATLSALKQKFADARAEVERLNADLRVTGTELEGLDKGGGLNQIIGGIAGKFGMSASTFTGVGAAVAAAGAAFKLAGDNIRTAMGFERSMSQLSSLTGMVGRDLEQLKEYAIELGGTTTLSASQVADAFRMIGSQQPQLLESGEALKEVTKYAITLSEAAGIDLTTAAQTLSTSINQMGGDSNNASRYVNVLAAASQKGAGDIAWLGEAITKSATAAKAVGTDYEELVANLEQLAKAGFDASTAGTALRSIIMNLEKQTNQDYKPSIVGLTQAFENLRDAHLDITGYQNIAGKMFATQAMALANAAGEARNMTEAITGTNTATAQATTNTANLDGSLKSLSSAWEALNLHINSSNGALKVAVDGLTSIVREADAAYKAFDQLTGGADKMAKVISGTVELALESITQKFRIISAAVNTLNVLTGNATPKQTSPSGSTDVTYNNPLAQSIKGRSSYYGEMPETPAPTPTAASITVDADTSPAVKKISELKAEIKELNKLKIAAADMGDDDAVDEYNRQIKELQAELKSRLGTSATTTHKQTDAEKAQQTVDTALSNYAQTIKEADLRMQAGLDNTLDHKRKELQAQEQLFTAYGRAIAIYDDPKLRTAYNEAAARYQSLASEVKQQTDASEAQKKAARELESAQKKLATAQRELDTAAQSGDRKAYLAAERKVTTAQAEVERIKT